MKQPLRILSYNIHKGFNATNGNFVLKQIKESIRLVHADIVFLQEVLGHHESKKSQIEDWQTAAQFEYLADQIWPHHAYGKNSVYTQGHHGNAILSKYPIVSWENINISTNKFESRGLLHVVVDVEGEKLHCMCLHLDLLESGRQVQIQNVIKRVKGSIGLELPLIIAGDFNDWRGLAHRPLSQTLKLKESFLEVYGQHARTFPSWFPLFRLDRVYLRHLQVLQAKNLSGHPWSALSDHTALFVEVQRTL